MPSRETMDIFFHIKHKNWSWFKWNWKFWKLDKWDRRNIWKDSFSTKFWKKVKHKHDIYEFRDEDYAFCRKCYKSFTINEVDEMKRIDKINKIL